MFKTPPQSPILQSAAKSFAVAKLPAVIESKIPLTYNLASEVLNVKAMLYQVLALSVVFEIILLTAFLK